MSEFPATAPLAPLDPTRGEHCGRPMTGVEYPYHSLNRYDGISEYLCEVCGTRFGRWTGDILTGTMEEPRWGIRR